MSSHADILTDNVAYELTEYGEAAIVHPESGADRPVTAIVQRDAGDLQDRPRAKAGPVTVQLPNSATDGIAASEITNRYHVSVARQLGGDLVKLRVTRWPRQDNGLITVELS